MQPLNDIPFFDYTNVAKKQAALCRKLYQEVAACFASSKVMPCILLFDGMIEMEVLQLHLERIKKQQPGNDNLVMVVFEKGSAGSQQLWDAMEAGISDVYYWQNETDFTDYLQSALKRKQEVAGILATPLVKEHLVGESSVWTKFLQKVIEASLYSQASMLFIGESGTGKELISRLVHTIDRRKTKKDLVLVDCTTIVPELSGSEFFGHERGSYTNALQSREGAFALADKGTLFLDEIGDLPLNLQAELLRVIQEGTFKKVGSNTWQKTAFRLICATHRNLRNLVTDNRFRHDLFFRLADFEFTMPSLKERKEDVPLLAKHFLKEYFRDDTPEFDDSVLDYLVNRDYPGNIRELRQLINRIAHRHVRHKKITPGEIPPEDRQYAARPVEVDEDVYMEISFKKAILSGASLRDLKNLTMGNAIKAALEITNGHKKMAADKLGVTVRAVQQFLKNKL